MIISILIHSKAAAYIDIHSLSAPIYRLKKSYADVERLRPEGHWKQIGETKRLLVAV